MAIESEFLELMPDAVTWYPATSTDRYGKRSFSLSGTSLRCRVSGATRARTTGSGRSQIGEGTLYVYGTPAVSVQDKIVLPTGQDVEVLTVDPVGDQNGDHHLVITYGAGGGA